MHTHKQLHHISWHNFKCIMTRDDDDVAVKMHINNLYITGKMLTANAWHYGMFLYRFIYREVQDKIALKMYNKNIVNASFSK